MSYTADEIEELFKSGSLERIGMGSRRSCYRLPGDSATCLKCYRSDEEIAEGKTPGRPGSRPLAPGVIREIRSCRFDELRNTCCQEYRYWKDVVGCSSNLRTYLPSVMQMVLTPSRGWCLIEEFMTNDDSSPVEKFITVWRETAEENRRILAGLLDNLEEDLIRHAFRFFDPQTVMVQRVNGRFRLRIPDFEPATRTLIPIDAMFPLFTRMKIRRRFKRFLKTRNIRP